MIGDDVARRVAATALAVAMGATPEELDALVPLLQDQDVPATPRELHAVMAATLATIRGE